MIRLVCVGLAGMGKHHWTTAAKRDDIRIVAGADVNEEARAAFEEQTGAPTFGSFEEALDHV